MRRRLLEGTGWKVDLANNAGWSFLQSVAQNTLRRLKPKDVALKSKQANKAKWACSK